VYHEGRAFRVVRALLSLGHKDSATADTRLPTKSVRICRNCGAGHWTDEASMCHACGVSLGDAEIVNHIYRIENVATQPAERITANDEERQRQGFDLQTTFEWAVRDHILDRRRGAAADEHGEILRLAYGPGATISRLNKGLRRRADKKTLGFRIDPVSGYWAKNEDEGDGVTDPTASPRQWIVPSVRDHKNALLLQPSGGELSQTTLATLQHALLRGIESVFQLEQGEILAEPMPSRDERKGFLLYEATEGGAGVLTRLVAEPKTLASVALVALQITHFDVTDEASLPANESGLSDAQGTSCVAACYRCLMSYFNQPDHEIIDRRNGEAKELLRRLARATTTGLDAPVLTRPSTRPPPVPDSAYARWLELARTRELPRPDSEPLIDGELQLPLVWRAHYVVAVFESTPSETTSKVEDKGFEVVVFGSAESTWPETFDRLAKALGRSS
jgi:hypothetical protein